MAIPFLLPSDDEAEVQGQDLEQLMLALYAALQQVLRNRNDQHPSRNQRCIRRPFRRATKWRQLHEKMTIPSTRRFLTVYGDWWI